MSEEEFDLLDELYFVQPYTYLKEALGWEDDKLLFNLQMLNNKGFIKCLSHPDQEIFDNIKISEHGQQYFYLATKKGLMNHNTK